ncbi:MAG: hypothetical protein ACPGXY_02075 [Alphaproteobacteria bacterium]
MTITYRGQKGAPLTIEEMDANFRELEEAIEKLRKAPVQAESIQDVRVDEDQLTFIGSQGTQYPAVTMPTVPFKARGRWQATQSYIKHDVVMHETSLFACTKAHTASENFTRDSKMWQVLLQAPAPEAGKLAVLTTKTLPKKAILGQIVLVTDDPAGGTCLVYFDSKVWRRVHNQKPIQQEGK